MNAASQNTGVVEKRGVLHLGNLEIDRDTYRIRVHGQYFTPSLREFDLLLVLAENAGHVVAADEITLAIWGATGHSYLRRLSVLVHRLRAKLADSAPYQVESIRGRGYGLLWDERRPEQSQDAGL